MKIIEKRHIPTFLRVVKILLFLYHAATIPIFSEIVFKCVCYFINEKNQHCLKTLRYDSLLEDAIKHIPHISFVHVRTIIVQYY